MFFCCLAVVWGRFFFVRGRVFCFAVCAGTCLLFAVWLGGHVEFLLFGRVACFFLLFGRGTGV